MANNDVFGKLPRGFYDDASFVNANGGGPLVLNSFTGVDISAYILMPKDSTVGSDESDHAFPAIKQFAELETVSISSARSVFPVRRLGEDHVHRYTRGGRTIAGTMVFTTFSRDVFAEFYRQTDHDRFNGQSPFFVDQIPPFHLLFAAANEYGVIANAALINVTLSNWGTTLSVHDLKIESTYTYVAQFFLPFVQDYSNFIQKVSALNVKQDEPLSQSMNDVVARSINRAGNFGSILYGTAAAQLGVFDAQIEMIYRNVMRDLPAEQRITPTGRGDLSIETIPIF